MAHVSSDDAERARDLVLRKLSAGPHSTHQLRQALVAKDIDAQVAEHVLTRYTELGLINDAEYADLLVRSKMRNQYKARRALAMDLRQAGIDEHTAHIALESIEPDQERRNAMELVAKKLPSLLRHDDTTIIRRLTGMLARRGYQQQLAHQLVVEALNEARTNSSADSLERF